METEGRIHEHLVNSLLVADEVWVPSEWNKQTFMNSGLNREINVMPLGVDVELYRPQEQQVYWSTGTKRFTFLSVFNWNWRKGFDVLLKAYARAFRANDDVSLVMVSRFVGQTGGAFTDRIFEDVDRIRKDERENDLPHLVLVDEVIPTYMMPMIYNSADAFVFITRGEGFALPPAEAGASGLPVISADHGGQSMFLNEKNSLLIKPDRIRRVDKSIEWISPFYHGMDFVDYSDDAIDKAAEMMRFAYEHPELLRDRADKLRELITTEFTWKKAAERVYDRLKNIQP